VPALKSSAVAASETPEWEDFGSGTDLSLRAAGSTRGQTKAVLIGLIM
jgi:hypothetical protein